MMILARNRNIQTRGQNSEPKSKSICRIFQSVLWLVVGGDRMSGQMKECRSLIWWGLRATLLLGTVEVPQARLSHANVPSRS